MLPEKCYLRFCEVTTPRCLKIKSAIFQKKICFKCVENEKSRFICPIDQIISHNIIFKKI